MPPNPIFVKLKVVDPTAGPFCFLGRPNAANVHLATETGVELADPDADEPLPVYRVADLILAGILRKIYISFKDTDGYLHTRPMLISELKANQAGFTALVTKTYKTGSKTGAIIRVRQKRKRTLIG